MQMTPQHAEHGYKVSYESVGIDESKELGLTLTTRHGLWAGSRVQQLRQVRHRNGQNS